MTNQGCVSEVPQATFQISHTIADYREESSMSGENVYGAASMRREGWQLKGIV